jgi:hypothetical protein
MFLIQSSMRPYLRQRKALTDPATHSIPSAAIRGFHAEMLDKAKEALNGVPVEQRFFFGHTMPFDATKLREAVNLMV